MIIQTDTKTRGMWGEVRLGTLLEQILSPDQFVSDVATKDGGDYVEFAIKLPGQSANQSETVLLPISRRERRKRCPAAARKSPRLLVMTR